MLGQIKLDLALETAGVRGFVLTGDSTFVTSYARARANSLQRRRNSCLSAGRLGGEVATDVTRLSTKLRLRMVSRTRCSVDMLPRSEFVAGLNGGKHGYRK